MSKYTFHTDPGHGWLEVSLEELVRLGIADDITAFSYQQGDKVFLEEDCDAGAFIKAKEALGEAVEIVEKYKENTPIRGYACFQFKKESR